MSLLSYSENKTISDCGLEKLLNISDFVFTFQIASDSWELAVRECCRWYCLGRGGERCRHHRQGGGVSAMDRPVEMDWGCDRQPGDTDGGCNGGSQTCREGNGGFHRRSLGQRRRLQSYRLPLVIGQSTYRQVYNGKWGNGSIFRTF